MRVKISKTKTVNTCIPAVVLFLTLCEFLYTKNTGNRSAVVLIVLWGYSFAYNIIRKKRFTKQTIVCLLVAAGVLLYSNNTESIRYFLLLTSMIFWSKIEVRGVEKLTHLIVIASTIRSVIQIASGVVRTSGIFANSPTQMSCLLVVCEYYLLLRLLNNGINWMNLICCVLCVPMIFFTESRSTLAAGVVLFAVYMIAIAVKLTPVSHKRTVLISIMVPMAVIVLLCSPALIEIMMSKMHRTNNNASTMTRLGIYTRLLGTMSESITTILFGKGGGFVKPYLMAVMRSEVYFPAHQDFLLIACEYGVIGLLTIFISYFWSHKLFAYFLVLYGVGSFHNILLTPTTMMFMVITLTDLERHQQKIWM